MQSADVSIVTLAPSPFHEQNRELTQVKLSGSWWRWQQDTRYHKQFFHLQRKCHALERLSLGAEEHDGKLP